VKISPPTRTLLHTAEIRSWKANWSSAVNRRLRCIRDWWRYHNQLLRAGAALWMGWLKMTDMKLEDMIYIIAC